MPKQDNYSSSSDAFHRLLNISLGVAVLILFMSVYVAPRVFTAWHGIGINHESIRIICEYGEDKIVDYEAKAPDNIYHDLATGGYRFTEDGKTTVVGTDVSCIIIITPKKKKDST